MIDIACIMIIYLTGSVDPLRAFGTHRINTLPVEPPLCGVPKRSWIENNNSPNLFRVTKSSH
jgi:hypothetical protein